MSQRKTPLIILSIVIATGLVTQRFLVEPTAPEQSANANTGPARAATNSAPLPAPESSEASGAPLKAASPAAPVATSPPDGQISPEALKMIGALEEEKANRSPAQLKMDSKLVYAEKMGLGQPVADGVPTQRVHLEKDAQDRVVVDIKATVSQPLLAYIETLGGAVVHAGVASRAGRLLSSATLLGEAASAKRRSLAGTVRVLGLKTDPDRYREHLASASA